MASSGIQTHGDNDESALFQSTKQNIPKPPPLPCTTYKRFQPPSSTLSSCLVPQETVDTWDKLFKEGIRADTYIETDNNSRFLAHSCVLAAASPVISNILNQSKCEKGKTYLKIHGVPYEAVYTFVRFLYSSRYEKEEMKKFVLHLLVLSHYYSVPSLKRLCIKVLEQGWINNENVIDVLQLARNCDATRISFICVSMIIKDFEYVTSTEGWKVMRKANPLLEKELYERSKRKVCVEVYEAMEALVHIYRDGCGTIGPRDKALKGSGNMCAFPACKVLESALRHFLECKSRVSCLHCQRIGQLLQLHSCVCDDSDSCKVPLCRNFKEKMKKASKKEESKWRLLAGNVIKAKNSLGPFSSRSFALV